MVSVAIVTRRESGMVTAETAVVLPFVILVAASLMWVVSLGTTQMRVSDAARDGARVMARGQTENQARAAVGELVPGAVVSIQVSNGRATVRVRTRAEMPLISKASVRLSARAVAVIE